MSSHQAPFRNQRPDFRRLSSPYADKPVHNARGLFPSRKCGIQIHFWTWQELNFIKLAEASIAVVRYDSRPERVMLRDGPDWFAYVPHFIVHLADRTVVVEMSHQGKPASIRKELVAGLARAHYREQDIGFAELSHAVVRARPRYRDANLLMRYLSVTPDPGDVLLAHDTLWDGAQSLSAVSEQSGVSPGRLIAMIRLGELTHSSAGPITSATMVDIPGSGSAA